VLACAGWGLAGAAENTPIENAKGQFETNFWGAVRVVNASLPRLRERGRRSPHSDEFNRRDPGYPLPSFLQRDKFALEGYADRSLRKSRLQHPRDACRTGNFKTNFTAARKKVDVNRRRPVIVRRARRRSRLMERDEVLARSRRRREGRREDN